MTNDECLLKAEHSAGFALSDLKQAMRGADPVHAIIILQLNESVAEIGRRISQLREAIEESQCKTS